MEFIFLAAAIVLIIALWKRNTNSDKRIADLTEANRQREIRIAELTKHLTELGLANEQQASEMAKMLDRITELAKYEGIVDADAHAKIIISEAENALAKARTAAESELATARSESDSVRKDAALAAKNKIEQADAQFVSAAKEAERIVASAKQRADEIAGEAYTAMNRAKEFADTAQAMKNIIKGYGDNYIVPTYSLLDDLAEAFSYTEGGKRLKEAREASRVMVRTGWAATCDYVEANRKEIAIRFVVDAFNGKVDSILSRSKADNHGKLEQEIRDAFSLVNFNGTAFRNARITDNYLAARLDELKWAATAHALRDKEREEQRQLREQMREEEKARREYERAIKEAAKEEETLKKALEKTQQQVAAASDAQRAEFEARLHELEEKLAEAEEKNKRALSMAQQTRAGHVYIISNIGSFGENVLKVGMTRRLEPRDRIRELGDASVPFEFDIHAMIFSDDAPSLEKTLHRHFLRQQMNKVNPRKEYFRLSLQDIREGLEKLGVNVSWTMSAAALEYRETLRIEQQIRDNPNVEKAWEHHQIVMEAAIEETESEAVA